MLLGVGLLVAAALWHRFIVRRFEGECDMERDVEWNEVAERARGKIAAALDIPVGRVELDYAHRMLYVPLSDSLMPYNIEAVMHHSAPTIRSNTARWQSDHARSTRA
jgi:hypothetical protein